MPGIDSYQQGWPYPKLSDAPNIEPQLAALVNAAAAQTNLIFASVTARSAALPTPVAGMETWLIAEGRKELYTGSAWVVIPPAGQAVAYTPVFTGVTMGLGTVAGRYTRVGNLVDVSGVLNWGSGSALGTGPITVTLPFTPATVSGNLGWQGTGMITDAGVAFKDIIPFATSGTLAATLFAHRASDGAWANPGAQGYGWSSSAYLRFQLQYEAA